MRAPSRADAGFTLLEVLVALAILSLAVVASIQAFAGGLRSLKLGGDHQQATLLADEKLREVVDLKEGRDAGLEGRLRWERTLRVLETPDLVNPQGTARAHFFEIDVRVSWEPQREVRLVTYRLVPPPTTAAATPESADTPRVSPGTERTQTPTQRAPTSSPRGPFGAPGRSGP